ncbi:MAG: PEGA domain-containing protein [Phycisphaeraceae bacterium]
MNNQFFGRCGVLGLCLLVAVMGGCDRFAPQSPAAPAPAAPSSATPVSASAATASAAPAPAGALASAQAGDGQAAAAAPAPVAAPAQQQQQQPPAVVLTTPQVQTVQVARREGVRNVAIFVKNHAGKALDSKVMALEDLVSSRITEAGFSVISREDVINSVASLAGQGANVGKADGPGADLDAILSNQTSALALARNLGANYVFTVSLTTYNKQSKTFKGNGIETLIVESKLRVSYKILDQFLGGTLAGDVVEVTKKVRGDKNVPDQEVDFINDLLDDASVKLASSLQEKVEANKIREVAGDASLANFEVICSVQGMTVPDVVKNDKGEYILGTHRVQFEAMNVTVELNGAAIGTAPGKFKVAKGMSKLRLSRDGCKDWERTVSISDGQQLRVDMQLDDKGYARWKDTTGFLSDLKADAKLTDAQVKVLEGYAQMLRQSGYKVDVKIDSDLTGTTIVQGRSLWGW